MAEFFDGEPGRNADEQMFPSRRFSTWRKSRRKKNSEVMNPLKNVESFFCNLLISEQAGKTYMLNGDVR